MGFVLEVADQHIYTQTRNTPTLSRMSPTLRVGRSSRPIILSCAGSDRFGQNTVVIQQPTLGLCPLVLMYIIRTSALLAWGLSCTQAAPSVNLIKRSNSGSTVEPKVWVRGFLTLEYLGIHIAYVGSSADRRHIATSGCCVIIPSQKLTNSLGQLGPWCCLGLRISAAA
jgi:hypothetical protein